MSVRSVAYRITPPGRSAIATIAVVGPSAPADVEPFFRSVRGRRLDTLPVGAIAFGRWAEERGEELVVTRNPNGVEIHCHGGRAAAEAILRDLQPTVEIASSNDGWFEMQSSDPIERAARQALQQAATPHVAARLLAQGRGALRRRLQEIERLAESNRDAAVGALTAMLEQARFGLHLTEPWRVVLSGPPNVGKSSLINRLVGYERAVVYDLPGTTRDVVTAISPLAGWPVAWSDTAGLRDSDDPLEQEGVRRATAALAEADLVLQVRDAQRYEPPRNPSAATNAVTVWNKADLVETELVETNPAASTLAGSSSSAETQDAPLLVSAVDGVGVERLLAVVEQRLLRDVPAELDHPLLFTKRLVTAVETTKKRLAQGEPFRFEVSE